MKTKTILFSFSLILVFMILPQLSGATQVVPDATVINDETQFRLLSKFIEQFRHRLNSTLCSNCTCDCDCDNCTCDCDCDCDFLRLRDRIQDRLHDFENCTMFNILNCLRTNE